MRTSSGRELNTKALADFWADEFMGRPDDGCICVLCRGKVVIDTGARMVYCICPNGMAGRKSGTAPASFER